MKFKRIISFLMVIAILIPSSLCVSATNATISEIVYDDSQRNQTIDELFAQRLQLEHDFEANKEAIDKIDQQLIDLGVEILSQADAAMLLSDNECMPLWEPVSTSTTQWTSRTITTVYRGYQFDVQIVEGVPISPKSNLRHDVGKVEYEAEGIIAGITTAISGAISGVLFDLADEVASDYVPPIITNGLTLLELFVDGAEDVIESLSTSTVFDRVSGVAALSMTGHMKYIFVKSHGSTNDKELYYIGNSVSTIISTVSIIDKVEDGKLITYHKIKGNINDTIQSPYYNDYSKAVANYWEYKIDKNADFLQDYTVNFLNIKVLGSNESFRLPTESFNYTE